MESTNRNYYSILSNSNQKPWWTLIIYIYYIYMARRRWVRPRKVRKDKLLDKSNSWTLFESVKKCNFLKIMVRFCISYLIWTFVQFTCPSYLQQLQILKPVPTFSAFVDTFKGDFSYFMCLYMDSLIYSYLLI